MGAGEQIKNKTVPNAENEMNAKAYIKFTLIAIMILMAQTAAWGQTVYYVKENASGTGDGSSWDNASDDLQKIIDDAYLQTSNGTIPVLVWVAKGTYIPKWVVTNNNGSSATVPSGSTAITDRDKAFIMRPNVHVYGGFAGGETFLTEQNWKNNETILSGDIGTSGDVTDNCYHVVVAVGNAANGSATLDGFVIKDAYSVNLPVHNHIQVNNTDLYRRSGAGIYIINSSFAMNNLEFRDNAAQGHGGAICAEGNSARTVTLSNSKIRGNRANLNGGGLFSSNTPWEINNVLFSGNTAGTDGGSGGAISFGAGGNPTLTNVTIAGNYAGTSNGGINGGNNATLHNTIVFGNIAGAGMSASNVNNSTNCYNCLIQGTSTLAGSDNILSGNTPPSNIPSAFREDFMFVDLVKPTGLTDPTTAGDYRLKFISPAIDKGNDGYATTAGITDDLDGNPRIHNGTVDIGAYEYNGNPYSGRFYVKEGATGDGSSWSKASGNLQLMMDMAAIYGDTVFVAAGNYVPQEIRNNNGTVATIQDGTPISVDNYAFVLRPNVKIFGGFSVSAVDGDGMDKRDWLSNKTTLDGKGIRHHVVLSVGDVDTAILDGFSITGGYARGLSSTSRLRLNDNNVIHRSGAGIYVFYSSPRLNNLDIYDNKAEGYGGGICIEYSNLAFSTLTNSMIRSNKADIAGGGIADINNNSQEVLYVNLAITGNEYTGDGVDQLGGGGFYAASTSVTLINATIVDNTSVAPSLGAGIRVRSGTTTLRNSIVWDNPISVANSSTINYSHSIVSGIAAPSGIGNLNGALYDRYDIFVDPDPNAFNYHLKKGSPCIDKGNNAYNTMPTDLEGNARIYKNDIIDMGAYEKFLIRITDVTEDYAPVTGGKIITIEGVGLLAAGMDKSDVWVKLCGVPATTIVSATDSKIVCIVGPSDRSMFGSIELSNGIESEDFPKHFTYYPVNFIKNGAWSEPYNWETQTDDRILPYPGAAVHINANCLQDIDLKAGVPYPVRPRELIFEPNGNMESITVHPNKAYTIANTKTLEANVFTLKDNASFLNYGTMNATEQNLEHLLTKDRNWYVSNPIDLTQTPQTIDAAFGTSTLSNWRVEEYDENTNNWTGLSLGSTLINGMGYTVYSKDEDIAVKFSGKYNDGITTSPTLTLNSHLKKGFNLVGNPFPSYWRWTESAASNANVYSTIWYRTFIAGEYEFWSYNAAGNVAVAPGPGDWEDGTPTGAYSLGYIPPMQAFWVRVKDVVAPNEITFDNNRRSHADHPSNILKSKEQENLNADERQMIRIVVNSNKNIDETLIYADNRAQNGFDDYDGDKWFTGANAEIFTLPVAENRELVINGLPEIVDGMEIPLGFVAREGGNFSFFAKEITNLDDLDIFLRDKWRNVEFNLAHDEVYNFTSGSDVNTERFSIVFRTSAATNISDDHIKDSELLAYSNNNKMVVTHIGNDDVEVRIYDVLGKRVAIQTIAANQPTTINGQFTKGIYTIWTKKKSTKVAVQ